MLRSLLHELQGLLICYVVLPEKDSCTVSSVVPHEIGQCKVYEVAYKRWVPAATRKWTTNTTDLTSPPPSTKVTNDNGWRTSCLVSANISRFFVQPTFPSLFWRLGASKSGQVTPPSNKGFGISSDAGTVMVSGWCHGAAHCGPQMLISSTETPYLLPKDIHK